MDELIEDHGLDEELEDRMVAETGNTNFWLGYIESMDEESDGEEDPEAALRKEVDDKHAFVDGARCIVEARETARELERARMRLEDNDARETARELERARMRLEDLSGLR